MRVSGWGERHVDTVTISIGLVRIVVLSGAAVSLLIFGRRLGARWRTHWVTILGIVLVVAGEGLQLGQLSSNVALGAVAVARETMYVHVLGYLGIFLGILLWIRDLEGDKRELKQDNRHLRRLAEVDFLTELVNRRHATLHLKREMARARRNHQPLGFIMMDLDHFKRVNDTHGHQVGDEVLAHVAKVLKHRVRESDIVIRYGGEEFLLVVPEADLANSAMIAEQLRLAVQESSVKHGGTDISVQASFGVAVAEPGQNSTVEEVIARADEALYDAKGLGRNRVVTWTALPGGGKPAATPAASAGT